jgi:threonine dehydratase
MVSGRREINASLTGSLCDALLAPTPAELPFAINRERLSRVLTVSDYDVLRAIRFVYEELRLVTEPGGVIALASLLSHPDVVRNKTVLVVVSGGNVDPVVFKRALDIDVNTGPINHAA